VKATVSGGEAMPEHNKPLTKKIRGFVQSENTVSVWSQRIRRNTWPRAKVYLSTDACLFSQAAMKAPPKRFY
jgi:hypothetical protein